LGHPARPYPPVPRPDPRRMDRARRRDARAPRGARAGPRGRAPLRAQRRDDARAGGCGRGLSAAPRHEIFAQKTQSHKDVGLAAKPLSISAIAARASDQLKRGCAADTPSSWLCVFVRTILSLFLSALADLPYETRPPRLRQSRSLSTLLSS